MSKRCLGCMELYEDEFQICPHCGYVVGTNAEEAIHMEPGSLLNDRYIVGKVLGYGGFGVTYIGWDGKLEQKIAIKEYLPSEFSTRMPGQTQVTVFNGEKNEQFHDGLKKFVEEAKRLAKFQNEAGIVKVFDSFVENETAYIIMEYLDGETLSEYLNRNQTMSEDDAVDMLIPVMQSLQVVHEEGILHRDIAPDNIFITKTGEIKLIDFGASRYATTSHSRSLTVIIKPGYSPEEQYLSRGDQGAHTDVYALSATLYKMITGKVPPDAMERRAKYENQNKDILEEPHKLVKISRRREVAILNAMNVRIEDRTPDVATFIKELNADPPAKRIYGKIKKLDFYAWPIWLKALIPSVAALFVVFGLLLATGVIKFSRFTEEIVIPQGVVVIPDVEGMSTEEALKQLNNSQLLVSTDGTVKSEFVGAGKIILQSPVGGSYINVNGTVLLKVSSGSGVLSPENGIATVPYVIWDSKDDAIKKLTEAGFGTPEILEEYDENVSVGHVVSQSLAAGEKVDEGTAITLVISLGPRAFDMPDVVGKTFEEAKKLLESKGLVVDATYRKDNSVSENQVLEQSISYGTEVKRGNKVILTVSSGKELIEIPNVSGKTQEEAEKILKDLGFEVSALENHDPSVEKGKVIEYTPNSGTPIPYGSTVTIYVSKGKNTITVNYDAKDGSVSPESQSTYVGNTYDLPTPTRAGYTFLGWYSEAGLKVENGTIIETTSAHTLYAQWKANTYTVRYGEKSKVVTYDSNYGDLPTISKTGYIFNGWTLNGNVVTADTVVKTAGDHTLEAKFTPITYTIAFDGNGATSGSTSSISATYDKEYTLTNGYAKTGYTFSSWKRKDDGGNFGDGASVSNLTASNNSTVTFVAQWTLNSYTLNFNANGGSVSESSRTVNYGAAYGTLPTPTRTGYTFAGWYTSVSGGSQVSASTTMGAGNTTAYAQWTPIKYTVSFNANGGSVSESSRSVNYGAAYGTLPTPTRTGYTFAGWYTSASGGSQVSSSTTMGAGNTIVYAQWTVNYYTLSFNSNGGSVSSASSSIAYGGAYGTLPTPTRTGYTFTGWYTSASGGSQVSSSTTMGAGNATIYAHWTVNSYTYNIVYKSSNGTSLGNSTATYAFGTTNTISAPVKSGYDTPAAQSVTWDSTSKTITFTYIPTSVSVTTKSGTVSSSPYITYSAKIEYRNRTATSVQIRVVWTATIKKGTSYTVYGQRFTASVGSVSTGVNEVIAAGTWKNPSSAADRSNTKESEWITISLNTTNQTNINLSVYYYQVNYNGLDMYKYDGTSAVKTTWSITIPAY